MRRTGIIALALVSQLSGATARAGVPNTEEKDRKAVKGGANPRQVAERAFNPTLPVLNKLIGTSKERPKKIAQTWDSTMMEQLLRWKALARAVAGNKRKPPSGWKDFVKVHESFLGELHQPVRLLLMWRHQTRVIDDSLYRARKTFPARAKVWFGLMKSVEKSMVAGERLLKSRSPSTKKIDAAISDLTIAIAKVTNVSYDARAVKKLTEARLGKSGKMPTHVRTGIQRLAEAPERFKILPEKWRSTLVKWASQLKLVQGKHLKAQEAFDRTFRDVVKQKVFQRFPHFKGKPYQTFPAVVLDLIARLRVLRVDAAKQAEKKRLMAKDRELNAKECRAYEAYMEATSATKTREASLKHARGCSAGKCRESRLEGARGPCSATNYREKSIDLANLSFERERDLDFQKDLLRNKSNSAADRARIQKRIEELSKPSAKEWALVKFLDSCDKNTNEEQRKLDKATSNVCENKGPQCKKFNDAWDQFQKEQNRLIKEQRRRQRKRESRRRKIGLDSDTRWRDCP